jgi:hypothetical protein
MSLDISGEDTASRRCLLRKQVIEFFADCPLVELGDVQASQALSGADKSLNDMVSVKTGLARHGTLPAAPSERADQVVDGR